MSCDGPKDIQGYAAKVDSSGNMQTVVNGTASVAVQGTANVAVQGTANVAVQGTPDVGNVGSVSGNVSSKPAVWSLGNHGTASIGTAASLIAPSQPGRVYILFMNVGSVDVFIYGGLAVSASDIKIVPGASLALPGGFDGDWYGMVVSGTSSMTFLEFIV